VHRHTLEASEPAIYEWMLALADRLRRVRVCCGDWKRVLGPSATEKIGVTGVFLDPPYSAEADRDPSIYSQEDLDVAHRVREWALEHGDNPKLRIALCGYEGEHEMPETGSASRGRRTAATPRAPGTREREARAHLVLAALRRPGGRLSQLALTLEAPAPMGADFWKLLDQLGPAGQQIRGLFDLMQIAEEVLAEVKPPRGTFGALWADPCASAPRRLGALPAPTPASSRSVPRPGRTWLPAPTLSASPPRSRPL
jgi:hypothetical protein